MAKLAMRTKPSAAAAANEKGRGTKSNFIIRTYHTIIKFEKEQRANAL